MPTEFILFISFKVSEGFKLSGKIGVSLIFSFSGCWVNYTFTVQQSTAGLAFRFFNKKAGFSFSSHVASTENYKYMGKYKIFCV